MFRQSFLGGLALVLVSAYLCLDLGMDCWEGASARSWPEAKGTVTEVGLRRSHGRGGASYRPRIRYRYRVDGRDLEGERLRVREQASSDREAVEAVAAGYSVGGEVVVRYDPEDPSQSMVVPGPPENAELWLLAFGAFGAIGAVAMAGGS